MPRRCLFTLNNPEEYPEDVALIKACELHPLFRFIIFQGEEAETGTKHLQGYLELKGSRTFKFIKKHFLGPHAHIEQADGNSKQNIHYCTKPNMLPSGAPCECLHCNDARKIIAEGHPNWLPEYHRGKPAMTLSGEAYWDTILDAIKKKTPIAALIDEHPQTIAHLPRIKQLQRLMRQEERVNKKVEHPDKDKREIKCVWIYGSPGTGKTQAVWDLFPDLFVCGSFKNAFDFYMGEKTILWDDFYPIDLEYFLKLTDIWPVILSCRYEDNYARWNEAFITSNFQPLDLYKEAKTVHQKALLRRLIVVKLTKTGEKRTFFKQEYEEMFDEESEGDLPVDDCFDFIITKSTPFDSLADLLASEPYRRYGDDPL